MNTKNLLTLTIGIALAILVFLPAQDVLARDEEEEACEVVEVCAVAAVCVAVVSAEECVVVAIRGGMSRPSLLHSHVRLR